MLVRKLITTTALIFIYLYIPLTIIIYTPLWNNTALKYFSRSEKAGGIEVIKKHDKELRSFFLHTNSLNSPRWSLKDKQHLSEVRSIYDILIILFVLSLISLISAADKNILQCSTKYIWIALLLLIMILPFFKFFWRSVFHGIFFDNNLWKMKKTDLCYYLFPKKYFQVTFGLIISHALFLNSVVSLFIKSEKKS